MPKYKNDPKAKRYFWLKLKNDFFEQKEIKLLRRIAGGDTYTIIYLKMMLKSLKNDGKLFYEFYGDNFAEEIALDIDESPEDVAMTISYLESKGLIELIEQDEYFLNKVPEMIGSEAYSTERSRRHRERKKLQSKPEELQSNKKVLQRNVSATDCNEEIELDIEKELDIETEIETEGQMIPAVAASHGLSEIFNFWEQNGFGMLAPKTRQDLEYWVKDFQEIGATEKDAVAIVLRALEISVDNNVRKYNYANSILKSWDQKRMLTVQQIDAEDKRAVKDDTKDAGLWEQDWSIPEQNKVELKMTEEEYRQFEDGLPF